MSFTHSIMFHHFHDTNNKHLPAQGSLSANDFNEMLDWLSKRYNLIGAREYLERFKEDSLGSNDICLSFDDALLCQYDIAYPILAERGLDAFFFVYSSVFSGAPDNLEIFRYFRTNSFRSIEDFYKEFFEIVADLHYEEFVRHKSMYDSLDYLDAFPFYTKNDKWFRYLRDRMLGAERYEQLMFSLMETKNFDSLKVAKNLWMSEAHLQTIASDGHIIGLHSYSHPTQMSRLNYDEQLQQYKSNLHHLERIVGEVVSMSHPCGDYNDDTLSILSEMGIQIGFRSNLSTKTIKSKFEVPRDDHSNIFKAMKK